MKEKLFNFNDEQLEYITDLLTNNIPQKIDKYELWNKIDENMKEFLKLCKNKDDYVNFKKSLSDAQLRVFYYVVRVSKVKIPNNYY